MQYCSDTGKVNIAHHLDMNLFSVTCLKGEPLPDRYSMSRIASCYHDSDCPKNYSCTSQGERRLSVANRRQKAACCPSQGQCLSTEGNSCLWLNDHTPYVLLQLTYARNQLKAIHNVSAMVQMTNDNLCGHLK